MSKSNEAIVRSGMQLLENFERRAAPTSSSEAQKRPQFLNRTERPQSEDRGGGIGLGLSYPFARYRRWTPPQASAVQAASRPSNTPRADLTEDAATVSPANRTGSSQRSGQPGDSVAATRSPRDSSPAISVNSGVTCPAATDDEIEV